MATKGALTLYDQKKHQKDKVAFRGAPPSKSYSLIGTDYLWVMPTPDKENKFVVEVASEVVSPLVVVTAVETGPHVVISEVVPNPTGSDREEWLELYWGGEKPLAIHGYRIETGDMKHRFTIPSGTTIPPRTYMVFSRAITKLALTNSGSTVRLFDGLSRQIDATTYLSAREGLSWSRLSSGSFAWVTPTRAAPNAGSATLSTKKAVVKSAMIPATVTSMDAISAKQVGKVFKISGIVKSKQGSVITIADEKATMRVSLATVNHGAQKVTAAIGDTVTASGVLRKSDAGLRIVPRLIADIQVEKPKPVPIKIEPVVVVENTAPAVRHIPWSAIGVAVGSLALALLIKSPFSLKKVREYAVSFYGNLRRRSPEE